MTPDVTFEEFVIPGQTPSESYIGLACDQSDWVSLLQRVAIHSKSHKLSAALDNVINSTNSIFISVATVKNIAGNLLDSIKAFSDQLILENGEINVYATPESIRASLHKIDVEVRIIFKSNTRIINMTKSFLVQFAQDKLKKINIAKELENFFDTSNVNTYANIFPLIKTVVEREKPFLDTRLQMKEHCKAGVFSPEIDQLFWDSIFPLFQQAHMQSIDVIINVTQEWFVTVHLDQGRDSILVSKLLAKIKTIDHVGVYRAILDHLKTLGSAELDAAYNIIQIAGNLPLTTLQPILCLQSEHEMQAALAEADGDYQRIRHTKQWTSQLTGLLNNRLIMVSEHSYLQRDGLYLSLLEQQHLIYYKEKIACNIKNTSDIDLNEILQHVLKTDSDSKACPLIRRRATLHMLAILGELYNRAAGGYIVTVEQLLWVLLILDKPTLQFKLSSHITEREHSVILVVLSAIACLRTGTTYIEDAAQRLLLAEYNKAFLIGLGLSIEIVQEKQIYAIKAPDPNPLNLSNYYLNTDANPVYPDKKRYFEQALSDTKSVILHYYDAWQAALLQPETLEILQSHRQVLLQDLDEAWLQLVTNSGSFIDLHDCDRRIEAFRREYVLHRWQTTHQQLHNLSMQKTLSPKNKARVAFLIQRSEQFVEDVTFKHYKRSLLSEDMKATSVQKFIVNDEAEAILWYDHRDVALDEKERLTQAHFKKQLGALYKALDHPDMPLISGSEQLGSIIDHLIDMVSNPVPTSDIMATVLACIDLYKAVHWDQKLAYQAKIDVLAQASKCYYHSAIAKTMMQHLSWVTEKNSFYRWLESKPVTCAAEQLYALSQAVVEHPEDEACVKALHVALYHHQAVLNNQWFYFSFAWFFGYVDIRKVLTSALNEYEDLIKAGLYTTESRLEAKENGLCQLYLDAFQQRLQQLVIPTNQQTHWQSVLKQIAAIQTQKSGFGMLYELQHYLSSQRHIFMINRPYCFYDSKKSDQIDVLLTHVKQAIIASKRHSKHVVGERLFLSKKEDCLQTLLGPSVQSVSIKPGCMGGQDYFDVCVLSPIPLREVDIRLSITGFRSMSEQHLSNENKPKSLWVKRCYGQEGLFELLREQDGYVDKAEERAQLTP